MVRPSGKTEMAAANMARARERMVARTQNENTDGKTNPKQNDKKLLRYPLAMLDSDTDYLKIQIADYQPPTLDLGESTNTTELKKDGKTVVGKDGKPTTTKVINKDFRLSTGTETNKQSLKDAKTTIYLPIPQQLSDNMSADWGDGGLNALEAFGVSTASNVMDDGFSAISEALSAIQGNSGALLSEDVRKAVASVLSARAIGALGGNVSGSQLVSRATGQVFNPNLELLFDGVNLRSFPFSFEFFPRNQKEGQQVMEIIRTLKQSMTAKRDTGTAKIFIKAPMVFQLTYMKGPKPHPFLNKFLPMALVNMNLTYTGSNTYSTFYDGTPTHMRMDLVFKELNPVYAEDYKGTTGVGY